MIPSASASCIAMAEHISGSEAAFVAHMNETARLDGVSSKYVAKAQWYVNGVPAQGFGNTRFEVVPGKTSTLETTIADLSREAVDISFVLTMFNGIEKRAELSVPVEKRPLEYADTLNVRRAEIYPGKELTLTANLRGSNEIEKVFLPAHWQWDGQNISGYGNDKFIIQNDRANSAYTLKIPSDAQPGTHEISFVVGDASLTGVVPCIMSATIEIVSDVEK